MRTSFSDMPVLSSSNQPGLMRSPGGPAPYLRPAHSVIEPAPTSHGPARAWRVAVERVLDVRQDVDGFGRVADLDLLADAADADEARDGVLGFGPLRTDADLAGQGEDAVTGRRLNTRRHGDGLREGVVRRRRQHRVVAVVVVGQNDLKTVVQAPHPGDAPRGGTRRQILPIVRH